MTDSSAPGVDRRGGAALRLPHLGPGSVALSAILAVVVGAMVAVMYASHRTGHWWGDDWALYLRQAEGLLDGEPNRVLTENEFTVASSRGPAFSPPLYPWGFPLLLAPAVALVGSDLDRLTIVPILSSCVFAVSWFALARPRLGAIAALVGVPAVVLSPLLLGWTELIQSEWPFMAVTAATLVLLDRLVAGGAFRDPAARLAPLVVLGVGAAAAFTVRREGLAMVAAIALAQVVALLADDERRWWHDRDARIGLAVRLSAPHLSALAVVLVLQVALPSTLVPSYSGTGLDKVWRYRGEHVEHLAEVVGIKRPWDDQTVVLGSTVLGTVVVAVYLLAVVAGLILALTRFRTRDAHLAGYAVAAFLIGASFRVAINRYVCSVAPILLLLAVVAVHTLAVRGRRPGRIAAAAAALPLLLIAAGNLANAHVRVDRARAFAERDGIEWGPTHPDALAMFDAVERLSTPDAVIASPKARAMTWATERPAVQVDRYRPVPTDVDVALVVVERGSVVDDELAMSPEAYARVWDNTRFVVYQPVRGP